MNLNDNFLIYNNGINLNQKLRNSLSIKNPNIKIKGRTNFNNNMTIPNHKKNKSTLPNRTLYGWNFHSNNNNFINTLINQEKNINLKNISGSHSNNGSKININVNNNYIYNNNFPFNSKTIDNKNNFLNNNINTKYNLYNILKLGIELAKEQFLFSKKDLDPKSLTDFEILNIHKVETSKPIYERIK